MKKRQRNVAIGTLVAAGLGYVAGLLTAPKSGRQTRQDVQASARRAEKKLKAMHSELTDLIDKGLDKVQQASQTSQSELGSVLAKAKVVKENARELLSALHEGDSADKDLKAVISDVSHATKSLKKYLSKNGRSK